MSRFLLVSVAVVSGWSAATAGPIFSANLSGSQEVPPRVTPASGSGTIQFSDDLQSVRVQLQVSNINNIVDAHIHLGAFGSNGSVVLGFGPFPQLDVSGTITLVDATFTQANLSGPLAGNFAGFYQAALAGNLYFNVHTNSQQNPAAPLGPGNFPGGEVRGQLALVPEPASLIVFGLVGAAGVGAWRRRKVVVA